MEAMRLAGRLIVENGGEIYRVEETITRMGRAFGLEEVESFSVPSGVFISFSTPDGGSECSVTRVHKGATDLNRVDQVNAVSRRVEAGELTSEQALKALQDIVNGRRLPWYLLIPAAGLCAAGFAAMFNGGIPEITAAFAAGALVQGFATLLERRGLHSFVSLLLCGFLSTVIPLLLTLIWPDLALDAAVGAALMPMLPGLAMTNAVQDTIRGDLMSGLGHGIQALLTAAFIAGGAAAGTALWALLRRGALL